MRPILKKLRYIVFFWAVLLLSQGVTAATSLVSNDPNWLGGRPAFNTTDGNDFWLTFMTNNATETANPSLNLSLYIVAEQAVTAKVEVNGQQIGLLTVADGGGVAKMDHIAPALVYVPNNETETSLNRGVHVYSDDKTVAFSCYMLAEAGSGAGSTRDASLILPTRALGREYYIQTYTSDTRSTEFAIVATEGGTNVTITPTAQTSTKSPAGTDLTIRNMRKGYVYLVRSDEPTGGLKIDMSGTKICADKPIAVFQGNEAAKIASGPTGAFSANHLFEQALPAFQWGKEFYVGLTAHAKSNFYNVTAAEDGTTVTINGGSPVTLNAGESFAAAKALVSPAVTSAKIVANKPVMMNTYLSCGGANTEDVWTPEGDYFLYSWGNSTMATVPSWTARVKHMSFLADTISNESTDGVRLKYVQVVTKTADVNKLTLDGAAVPASSFTPFSADFTMSVANIELPADGKHTLETTGEGFVGFVYTITSEARAFQYTLGFTPDPYGDSLFINNQEALMKPDSYDMDSLDGHGWYQRQWDEWVKGKERLDTAVVCDSSVIQWTLETHPDRNAKTIDWNLYNVTDGIRDLVTDTDFPKQDASPTGSKHPLKHQFILPEEDPKTRHQFFDYELEVIVHRDQLICGGEELDTFRCVTRVTRVFNDTAWRAICMGDTLHYFYDSLYNQDDLTKYKAGEKKATKFAATKSGATSTDEWVYNVGPGTHSFTRTYMSQFGCDSIVTLELFVCDTFLQLDTIHMCSNQDTVYQGKRFKGVDYKGPHTGMVVRKTSTQFANYRARGCGCQTGKNKDKYLDVDGNKFLGCDSIYQLLLVIHRSYDTLTVDTMDYHQDKWKDSTYRWPIERDGVTRDSLITKYTPGMSWNDKAQAWTGHFGDTLRTKTCSECNGGNPQGCDSINSLDLIIPPTYYFDTTIVWCRSHYDWNTHTVINKDFQWIGHHGDIVYTKGGDYYDSCVSRYKADSIYHLKLVYSQAEHPLYDLIQETVCFDTITRRRNWTSTDGIVNVDTIRQDTVGHFYYVDESRCDSIYALELTVLPTYYFEIDKLISLEQTFTWYANGKTYGGPNSTGADSIVYESESIIRHEKQTVPVNGQTCDSIHVLILRMGEVYRDTVHKFVCEEDAEYIWTEDRTQYYVDGQPFDRDTITSFPARGEHRLYQDPYKTVLGFDSIFYLDLYRAPAHDSTDVLRVCQAPGSKFSWPGHGSGHTIYDAEGKKVTSIPAERYGDYWYTDSLTTKEYGCDSIWHLHLYVDSVYHYEYIDKTCQFDDYVWPDQDIAKIDRPINTAHIGDYTYTASYQTIYGCDSIWTLRLHIDTVYKTFVTPTDTFICDKDSLVFVGRTIYGSKAPSKPEDAPAEDVVTIPEGEEFTEVDLDGFIPSSLGCDSAVRYHLTVYRTYLAEEYAAACQPSEGRDSLYHWVGHDTVWDVHNSRFIPADSIPRYVKGDTTYVYIDSLRTTTCTMCGKIKGGCDSLFILHLRIDSTYHFYDTAHICENERYTWQNITFAGDFAPGLDPAEDTVRVPGVYHERVRYDAYGSCDSIYYLELYVHPIYHEVRDYTFHDNNITPEAHYYYFSDSKGNEYFDTVRFQPHKPVYEEDTLITYYDPIDVKLEHTLETESGCDSIVTVNIRILPTYEFVARGKGCFGDDVTWRGKEFSDSGIFYDSLKTKAGSDSVFVLEFLVKPVVTIPIYDTICDNETYVHTDTLWYTDALPYHTPYTTFDELVWKPGMRIPTTYTEVLFRSPYDGCDSIRYRYYLTICKTYHHTTTATLCSGKVFEYTFEYPTDTLTHVWETTAFEYDTGAYIPAYDTVFYDSLQTVMGCDSVFELRAHVLPSYRHVIYDTICENEIYTFRRFTFLPSSFGDTIVRDSLKTEHECDSIYELHLSVYPKFYEESFDTICADETYSWRAHFIEHLPAGDNLIYDSLLTVHGCDSVYHLYLHVKDTTFEDRFDTICYGDTLTISETGHMSRVAGEYKDTTLNEQGCHHFIYTHLADIPPTVPTVWAEDPMCQSEAAFDLFYTYTSHYPIAYSLYFDSAGLAMGFENQEDIAITEYTDPMVITVPIPYRDDDPTKYPKPGDYGVRLVLDNGICQHKETDCFRDSTFMMSYPKWLTEQRHGDVIALLNEKYNGGYVWSSYQWYQGDKMLIGQTNPYLYIPTGLEVGAQYHVRLTRSGDARSFPTCPITIEYAPLNDYAPTKGYLDVVPTCVVPGHPYVTIMSRHNGHYRITTSGGSAISSGDFQADATVVQVPSVTGMYIVQLWSEETKEEPYRAIKIVVRDICETCATSF